MSYGGNHLYNMWCFLNQIKNYNVAKGAAGLQDMLDPRVPDSTLVDIQRDELIQPRNPLLNGTQYGA